MVAGASNFHPNSPRDWEGFKLGGMIIGAMLGFTLLCLLVGWLLASIPEWIEDFTVEQNALTEEVQVKINHTAMWHLYRHRTNQGWDREDMILRFPTLKAACDWVAAEEKKFADAKAYHKAWKEVECNEEKDHP